ncbi:hypothetical protein WUBG_12869 [Wuchereria bancrofti]|uniref:Uncharacterized protein n=1 Tax=Wuchereria bancrofti TaxID=6293 RepID=J9EGT8_WUCBA|nr:hypothetical protein WUBG_12869 [Wuchereria bancrofti]
MLNVLATNYLLAKEDGELADKSNNPFVDNWDNSYGLCDIFVNEEAMMMDGYALNVSQPLCYPVGTL